MTIGNLILTLSIAAPGLVALRRMLHQRLNFAVAFAVAALLSAFWSVGVVLILATVRGSAIPGPLWVLVITAIVLVEVVARPPGHFLNPPRNDPRRPGNRDDRNNRP